MNEFCSSKEFLFLFLSLSLRCLLSLSPLIDKASLYTFVVCCKYLQGMRKCMCGWLSPDFATFEVGCFYERG
jgi:hypothetical protein